MRDNHPIHNTCPNIDKAVDAVEAVVKMCNVKDWMERDGLLEILKDIDRELWGIDGILEELRGDNSTLRAWGHEQEKRADELEEKLELA